MKAKIMNARIEKQIEVLADVKEILSSLDKFKKATSEVDLASAELRAIQNNIQKMENQLVTEMKLSNTLLARIKDMEKLLEKQQNDDVEMPVTFFDLDEILGTTFEIDNNTIPLPQFRAKRVNENEYVVGVPRRDSKGMYEMIINTCDDGVCGVIQRYIEPETLAIHLPDMIDSDGGKIFASLFQNSKGRYAKGGDIVEFIAKESGYRIEGAALYRNRQIILLTAKERPDSIALNEINEVTDFYRISGICQ